MREKRTVMKSIRKIITPILMTAIILLMSPLTVLAEDDSPVSITKQPVGGKVAIGKRSTLTLSAETSCYEGFTASYQWEISDQNTEDSFTEIPGATKLTYVIDASSMTAGTKYYRMKVIPAYQQETADSAPLEHFIQYSTAVKVEFFNVVAPSVTYNITSPTLLHPGKSISVKATASIPASDIGALRYIWYVGPLPNKLTEKSGSDIYAVSNPADGSQIGTSVYLYCDVRNYFDNVYAGSAGSNPAVQLVQLVAHSFGPDWKFDSDNHWQVCSCGEISTKSAHTWDQGTVTTAATSSSEGVMTYHCTICGFTKTEKIPVLQHVHNFSSTWNFNNLTHWHSCSCGEKADIARHHFSQWVEVIRGTERRTCDICGYYEERKSADILLSSDQSIIGNENPILISSVPTQPSHASVSSVSSSSSSSSSSPSSIGPVTFTAENGTTDGGSSSSRSGEFGIAIVAVIAAAGVAAILIATAARSKAIAEVAKSTSNPSEAKRPSLSEKKPGIPFPDSNPDSKPKT